MVVLAAKLEKGVIDWFYEDGSRVIPGLPRMVSEGEV